MNDFLEKVIDGIAYRKASRGEGTGPASKMFSSLNILIFVLWLVTLFKAKFYWVALTLLISVFTRFGLWVSIVLLIYFVIVHYWVGIVFLFTYGVIGWISAWLGIKNIKNNLYSGKTQVDPFEGMPDISFFYIFQVIFLSLALLIPGIPSVASWILFGIVTLFVLYRFYYRLVPRWRRLHCPLMVRYAPVVGYHSGIAKRENKKFDMDPSLKDFIKSIYPSLSSEELEDYLNTVDAKMESFAERNGLISVFRKDNLVVDSKKLNEALDEFHKHLKKRNPRWIIAEVIERDYGVDEKINYLQAILTGQAD